MGEDVILDVQKKIGAAFKKQRLKKGLSLRELDAATGVDHSWIGKFEKGLMNVQIDTLLRLASGVQIQIRDLVNFTHDFIDE